MIFVVEEKGEPMSKEYIERMRVWRRIANSVFNNSADKDMVEDMILSFPAADVEEVVRCKDCQWYGHKRACPLAASGLSADCIKLPKEDDFCSYGERRKENG